MFHIQVLDEVESTQDSVRDALTRGDSEGLVIRAVAQSAGRGRHGRVWDSLDGNLFFSVLLKPARPLAEIGSLALVVGVAVARAAGQGAGLKWPNDVLVDGKKCAGILCEVEGTFVIVGVGVNVNGAPDGGAVIPNSDLDAAQMLGRFLDEFEELYTAWQRDGFVAVKDQWLALAHPVGERVSVKRSSGLVAGRFAGVGDHGALLLEEENGGITTINSGELYVTRD